MFLVKRLKLNHSHVGFLVSLGVHFTFISLFWLLRPDIPQFSKSQLVPIEISENTFTDNSVSDKASKVYTSSAINSGVHEKPKGNDLSQDALKNLLSQAKMIPVKKDPGGSSGADRTSIANNNSSNSKASINNISDNSLVNTSGGNKASGLGQGGSSGTETGQGNGTGNGSGDGIGNGSGINIYGTSSGGHSIGLPRLPFIPRQIVEVFPQLSEKNVAGEIVLNLRIGIDGVVKEHKTLKNTTGSIKCLSDVVLAAYKSKWQAVTYKGSKIEYWVEKSYKFN
ncbi:MAG: hypothetical protein Q8940_17865 [Bacteroidota bacterium]|nr:hypothetical protein [Bacteroidota bacterium]